MKWSVVVLLIAAVSVAHLNASKIPKSSSNSGDSNGDIEEETTEETLVSTTTESPEEDFSYLEFLIKIYTQVLSQLEQASKLAKKGKISEYDAITEFAGSVEREIMSHTIALAQGKIPARCRSLQNKAFGFSEPSSSVESEEEFQKP
ncbi:unnamed protein product [Caenorhabditis auriculariae]|uniref:Uncharacterized protein n=1 Tax=Caenorhabditis auriculariae TaxID=2777116 RepID=A0A8S1HJL5_9PELO|nr:unnamed protein product [Caenorhabditis auriculariae]